MGNNIINTKNNNQGGVVKVSHEAASYYTDLAKKWAVKTDDKVDGSEYSAKYYATEAKKQLNEIAGVIESADKILENVKSAKDEITELAENSVNNINATKTEIESSIETTKKSALENVNSAKSDAVAQIGLEKTNAIEEIKQNSNVSIATTSQAGLVKPDGTTITITDDGTISSVGGSSSSSGIYIVSAEYKDFTDDERTHRASLGIDYALPYRHGYIYYSNGFVEMYGTDLLKYNSNVIRYEISLIGPELFYRPKAATNPCWAHHVSITPSLAVTEDDIFGNFGDVENLYKIYCLGARDLKLIVKNDTGRDVLINWRIWGLSRKGAVS